jgi:pSer/pThr/pTyr-binding forkhead associated (FHA) protein
MKLPPIIVVQLIHISGPMKGEIQEFSGDLITIGRHPSSNLCFAADLSSISRNHAEIIREGNNFRLVDHSSNGTYVNGKRVTETILKSGDVLAFSEGGPKVSFLTQMKEGLPETPRPSVQQPTLSQEDTPRPTSQPVERPVAQPVERPPAQPVERPVTQPVERPSALPVQKTNVPFIIQYGPMLRTYRELPITIGKNPSCAFVIDMPSIADHHAQFFFSDNQYWVKDLTGLNAIKVNRKPIPFQAPLKPNDEIQISPQGPVFRFLGEGRLAEVEENQPEQPSAGHPSRENRTVRPEAPTAKEGGGFFSKVKKMLGS